VTNFFLHFFGFFNKATAYSLERIFTQNTSEDVVPGMDSASEMTYNVSSGALNSTHSLTPGMEVPFGGLDNYI